MISTRVQECGVLEIFPLLSFRLIIMRFIAFAVILTSLISAAPTDSARNLETGGSGRKGIFSMGMTRFRNAVGKRPLLAITGAALAGSGITAATILGVQDAKRRTEARKLRELNEESETDKEDLNDESKKTDTEAEEATNLKVKPVSE
jgi:hypothetical protein